MRSIAILLLAAACATAPTPASTPERLAGCWIGRSDEGIVTTMRWLPDRARSGVMEGQLLEYRGGGAENSNARYTLEPRDDYHVMCSHWQEEPLCWRVAEGAGGSLDGGRVFVDASEESLRISVLSDGVEELIFDGRRDGCD